MIENSPLSAQAQAYLAAIVSSSFGPAPARAPEITVRQLGYQLMGPHAAALLVVGILLTVALIGATILASTDRPGNGKDSA